MVEEFSFYWQGSVVCIAVFLVMLLTDMSNANRQEKQVVFQRVLVVHILYFVNDIFYKGLEYGQIPFIRPVAVLINLAEFVLVSSLAIEWFLFIAVLTNMELRKTKRGLRIIRLPFIIMIAVIVIVYLIDPMFWLSETGEKNGLFLILMLLTPMIYYVWSTVYALRQAFRKENRGSRKILILIAMYPIEGMILGGIQRQVPGSPLYSFGLMVLMVFVYIQNMKDQISTDPLTKLNNSSQLIKYVAQEPNHHAEDMHTYVLMIDANNFKSINDDYGHSEGDNALVLIARALMEAGKRVRRHPFIGRYGGDEFILILQTADQNEPVFLSSCIREELINLQNTNDLGYELAVGIGYDEWTPDEDFQSCMVRADRRLYEDKKKRKPDKNRGKKR